MINSCLRLCVRLSPKRSQGALKRCVLRHPIIGRDVRTKLPKMMPYLRGREGGLPSPVSTYLMHTASLPQAGLQGPGDYPHLIYRDEGLEEDAVSSSSHCDGLSNPTPHPDSRGDCNKGFRRMGRLREDRASCRCGSIRNKSAPADSERGSSRELHDVR